MLSSTLNSRQFHTDHRFKFNVTNRSHNKGTINRKKELLDINLERFFTRSAENAAKNMQKKNKNMI